MNERKTVLMAASYGGDLPITALVMEKIRDADKKQVMKLCQRILQFPAISLELTATRNVHEYQVSNSIFFPFAEKIQKCEVRHFL